MNYNTHARDDGYHCIVETRTGLKIEDALTKEQAKSRVRFLNYGGGFDGWTPHFLMEKLEM